MTSSTWESLLIGQLNEDDELWELFHENSKTSKHEPFLPNQVIAGEMLRMNESLDYAGMPKYELPLPIEEFDRSLAQAIVSRVSPAKMSAAPLSLQQLSTLLFFAYGITRDNRDTGFTRPFRTVPSGGGLYPLELYFSSKHIEELPAGLYHYNPMKNHVRQIQKGDLSLKLADALVPFQRNLAFDTSVVFYITALFERSVFKYGNRGYRFVLFEAGHVSQNINLVATALDWGCLNIGGYFDREVDELLELDGINQSTVYMVGIGKREEVHQRPKMPSEPAAMGRGEP